MWHGQTEQSLWCLSMEHCPVPVPSQGPAGPRVVFGRVKHQSCGCPASLLVFPVGSWEVYFKILSKKKKRYWLKVGKFLEVTSPWEECPDRKIESDCVMSLNCIRVFPELLQKQRHNGVNFSLFSVSQVFCVLHWRTVLSLFPKEGMLCCCA